MFQVDIHWEIAWEVRTKDEASVVAEIIGVDCDAADNIVYNNEPEEAAYKFLSWAEDHCQPEQKWQKIIDALKAIEKDNISTKLRLRELLRMNQVKSLVSARFC